MLAPPAPPGGAGTRFEGRSVDCVDAAPRVDYDPGPR